MTYRQLATTFIFFLFLPSSLTLTGSWMRVSDAGPEKYIKLTFAVKLINTDWLDKRFWAVSNPQSPDYGRYLNFDEIAGKVKARSGATDRIITLLRSHGVTKIDVTVGENYIVTYMTCASANRIFSTTFSSYTNVGYPEVIIEKATNYKIPEEIADDIDFILGIDDFPTVSQQYRTRAKMQPLQRGQSQITPSTIWQSYNISSYESSSPENSQAVAAFQTEYFKPSDLSQFQELYGVASSPIVNITGGNNDQEPTTEASLDVQYITGVGRKVATWFIHTSEVVYTYHDDFLTWIIRQTNTTNSPWVHSVSYGYEETAFPDSFKDRVDVEFKKFGVSGRTVLFASGDLGVDCTQKTFVPFWPTSSPYVTSVGGTTIQQDKEIGWPSGGGGFSNNFAMPDYQKEVVQKYLQSGKAPPSEYFNMTGRAYPDLSAFATDFAIIVNGQLIYVEGTSCSAPTVAGIISLLNDVRMKQGNKTLGFLNPLLYQLAGKGFHDITEGSNGFPGCPGFKATEGWDPATGWGSPNFGILKSLV
jgi:tripeptidyl-peptidase-1